MAVKEFWITNISNMIVNLHDLNLFIKPYSSINLLNRRHLLLTENQIDESATSGSIFKKSDKIVVRKYSPDLQQEIILPIEENPGMFPHRDRSFEPVVEEVYEELLLTDEEVADMNSSLELDDYSDAEIKKAKNG